MYLTLGMKMERKAANGLEWLEFDLLSDFPRLNHAVFLKHGGYSEGAFSSLNTGLHVGDNPLHVRKNLEKICLHFQREISGWKHLIWGKATHGDSLAIVHAHSPEEIPDVDGIVTQEPGVTLMMKHADCQVAIFYDPLHHVAATVHCGWKGSVANIYGKTVCYMQHNFHSQPTNLLVCISPSLGPDEAEFIHYKSELPEEFWTFQVRPTYFNFWAISEYQLQNAGILPHHIEVAYLSTYANSADFFSYRRDKITGRHGTCVTLL